MSPQARFVELVHQVSQYYANWDPSMQFELGDFGKIHHHDLSFEVEGNIFAADDNNSSIAEELKIIRVDAPQVDYRLIKSNSFDVSHTAEGELTSGLITTGFKQSFRMTSSHGAFLVMYEPRTQHLDHPGKLNEMLTHEPDWIDRVVVTEVQTCAAYTRL